LKKNLIRLLFIGELPHTLINGVSLSNELNLKLLSDHYEVVIIEEKVDFSLHNSRSIKKFFEFLSRVCRLIFISDKKNFGFIYLILPTSFFGQFKILFTIIILKLFYKNAKFVIHLHRGDLIAYLNRRLSHLFVFRCIMRNVNIVLVLSDGLLNSHESMKLFDSRKFYVLPNTVSNEKSLPIAIEEKSFVSFIYMSHYIEDKGHLFLMDYFNKFKLFNYQLHCYGKIFNSNYFETIKLMQTSSAKLFGEIPGDNKFNLLNETDFFIMPSLNEGQPLVILEAMMCGVIVIANDVGFIKEMFWPDYPLIYNGNEKCELDRIMTFIAQMNKTDIIHLKSKIKDHYFNNYSNFQHKTKLINIFKSI
jgi:glycosyltransferase involved in cell wall biosynthesis